MKQLNFYRERSFGSHAILVCISAWMLLFAGCATTDSDAGSENSGGAGAGAGAVAGTGSEFSDAGATAGGTRGGAGGSGAGSSGAGAAGGSGSGGPSGFMGPDGWTDLGRVHFDFDRSSIRSDAVPMLKAAAKALQAAGTQVLISGNCDNRGSEEYNFALGERRATAVKRYLVNLGVSDAQLLTVSYGELRPLNRANNAKAWAENRRAEFSSAK